MNRGGSNAFDNVPIGRGGNSMPMEYDSGGDTGLIPCHVCGFTFT
jgi:hypothetical protein